MKRRFGVTGLSTFLALLASMSATIGSPAPPQTIAASQRPNIVVLMVDDLGAMDDRLLSVLPTIKSTFLEHGLRFTDYSGNDPVCCPGRTNFLSGQFAHHTGVTINDARLFDPRETIATELQGVGYQTFIDGKYLNRTHQLDNKFPPGWTKAFITEGHYWGGGFWSNGNKVLYPSTTYSTDLFAKVASEMIGGADARKPMFMYLTPYAPHAGTNSDGTSELLQPSPPRRYLNDPRCALDPWKPPNYAEADVSDKPAYIRATHAFYPDGWPLVRTCEAMLAVDDELAKVKAAMAAAGRTNTLYLFTSDNGMALGAHGWDGKAVPYATQMPLFIRWDAASGSAPRTISTTLSNVDIAPTLCALAGCQMGPYPNGFGVDGLSFAPLLHGHAMQMGRDVVLEESPGNVRPSFPRWSGVRTTDESDLGRWVYTTYETGECELYDLAADPWELENRCNAGGRFKNVQAQLAAALKNLRHDPPGPACSTTCYVDAWNGNDANGGAGPRRAKQHIQAAIDAVNAGGTVRVLPGQYRERATNRSPSSRSGNYDFGLFVPASKPSISIVGVDLRDKPITDPATTQAVITTIGNASFGPVGIYVDAAHTTFQGLAIDDNFDNPTATVEHNGMTFDVVADDFTLRSSSTQVSGGGSIVFEDPNSTIRSYHVIGNRFLDGATIDITDHTGTSGSVAGREIKGNAFDLKGAARVGIAFDGLVANAPGFDGRVGGATIANNSFTGTRISIRSRGSVVDSEFDWSAWFAHNTFDGAVMVGPNPSADTLTAYTDTCGSVSCPAREIGATIQRQINHAQAADTVLVRAGTYNESPTISTSITLKAAAGRDATAIALAAGPSNGGALTVDAPDVTVDGFTIVGRDGTPARAAATNIVIGDGLDSVTLRNNRFEVGEVDASTTTGDDGIGILTTAATTPSQSVGTLKIANNIFQPLHASAFRAWLVRPGVTNLTISGNSVNGSFDAAATLQAGTATVSNNTIAGSGSSASIATSGFPDPSQYTQTTFTGNDISGTNVGILVSEANNVTITNNVIHGVTNAVVFSDPGHFTADLVASSIHVNGNSFSNASGKLLTSAYPDPIDASDNWWGTASESAINAAITGQVDFTPFLDRGVDVGGAPGFQGDHATVHASALGSQTGSANRLVEAVDLVDPSGTIAVGPGGYEGNFAITKSVQLHGAHFGDAVSGRTATDASESRINGTLTLAARDIVVDGFAISDVVTTNDPAYGVVIAAGGSGATISHDVFDGITTTGVGASGTGQAIYVKNGPDDVSITDNRIANVSATGLSGGVAVGDGSAADAGVSILDNNITNISGAVVHAIAFDGPASVAEVRGNSISNLSASPGDAVAVWFDDDNALGDATVRRNNLDLGPSGYGIAVGTTSPPVGSVDGACNWWGDPSGPGALGSGSGSKVSSNVFFNPWLTSANLDGDCNSVEVGSAAPDALGSEGHTIRTSGSFTSSGPTPPTITADNAFGTFKDKGDGTWTWSRVTTDNFPSTTITVSATLNGSRAEDLFIARSANVPPSATFAAPSSVRSGSTFHPSLSHILDPSSVDTSAGFHFAFDCGTGSGFSAPHTSPTANCVAPANAHTITVRGKVIDKDGGARTYSRTVAVTQPQISLTPSAAAFGSVATGGGTRTRIFTVTNVGTAPLAVHDTSVTGANATQFSIDNDGCSGVTVAIHASCTIRVKFRPTTDGQKSASLVVHSDDPDLPSATSSLTGTGAHLGTIRITLETHPASGSSPYNFTGTGGIQSFQLPASGGTLTRVIERRAPASYTITEGASGWPLIGLTCSTPQTVNLAKRSVTIQLGVGATVDCTFVNSRRLADGMIGTALNGPFAGDNVYSSVPVASERANQVVPAGTIKSFWVVLQNDSLDPDDFGVTAGYSGSTQFQVKILRGNVDITGAMFAGTYTLKKLAAGGQVKLHIVVKAASTVSATATGTVQVVMRSKSGHAAVDLVEGNVSAQ